MSTTHMMKKEGYVNGGPPMDPENIRIAVGRERFNRGSWWGRRTAMERTLMVLIWMVMAVAIAMIVVVVILSQGRPSLQVVNVPQPAALNMPTAPESTVCMTQDCVRTSTRILESINPTVDPCDDFFEYACGSWNRNHPIPDDRATYNTFAHLADKLFYKLKELLESSPADDEPLATRKTRHLYSSCLNMNIIRNRKDYPLHGLLSELGGWPVLGNWHEENFDLETLIAKLKLYSNRVMVNLWVGADDKNSSANIILLDQAPLGLSSREYFLKGRNERTLRAYETFATKVAQLLGANATDAEQQMREMVDFEIELANLTVPAELRRDTEALYNKMTVGDLSKKISDKFDWSRYLDLLFNNVSMSISKNEPVVVYAPGYLRNVMDLAKVTSNRTIANYAIWRIVFNRVSNLHEPYLELRREFHQALYGTETDRARWRTCTSYTNQNFGMALGRLFVNKYFEESAKSVAEEMIQKIRKAFNDLLNEVPWMDNATRIVAKEKADLIQEKIGYPDYIMNNTAIDKDYVQLDIQPDKYFENVLNIIHDNAKESLKHLRDPVDRNDWSTTPAVVNAFYSATKNQIMFPAGILQPPFYQESYPKSMNFGGIAMVIGHEITHGFDDKGRQFDKDGNLKQWWTSSAIDEFKKKAQCIVDQYGNFTVPEVNMNLNGRQTLGENIADNGGLKQAYTAYRDYIEKERHGIEEERLPGLNLTHNQLFFLNFAQIWCGTARPESYLQSIRSGRHSPGRFRVIGSVSNSKDFAEAYNCPLNSPMNPKEKCSVW